MGVAIAPAQHELCVLDATGDTKTIWNKDIQVEVDVARMQFDAMKKKGYAAYKVDAKGEKGEVLKTFDPNVERMIMAPPMVGG